MRIDAHQHFWRIERGDYGWLTPDLGVIYRDYLPGDLAPLIERSGMEATVLIQAAPSPAETAFLIDLAARTPFVAGVIGWVDFEAPDAAIQIANLSASPKVVGLRPMIQDLADDAWMLRPTLAPAIEAMTEAGLTFDALVMPRHLPILRQFADRWPGLRIVIDHGAKPNIMAGALEPWASEIRAIASESECFCKLSGLVTEAAPGRAEGDLWPYVDALFDAFGPRRLMWGSDWPVLNRSCDYLTWLDIASRGVTRHVGPTDAEWIFGRTAAAFYGLKT
ncbi:MAG TPA: amidohydrolase family protein [Caulobacteraceae bacterium]